MKLYTVIVIRLKGGEFLSTQRLGRWDDFDDCERYARQHRDSEIGKVWRLEENTRDMEIWRTSENSEGRSNIYLFPYVHVQIE